MKRIHSIDVLRSITMFLMIFVNDVAGVDRIPEWLKHTAADLDGMGFSDLIFPAFLFIVGLSLPSAIQARIKKGKSDLSIVAYILLRALALIIMGFFQVNFENYNHESALISYPVYKIVVTLGFFLIWLDYPETMATTRKSACIAMGIVILALMAYFFKGEHGGMQPHWWGILGIIGWAYLFAALVYLATKGRIKLLIGAFLIFSIINITTHLNVLHVNLWMIGDASSITLMMAGALIATGYQHLTISKTWLVLAISGLLAIVFGFIIRPYAGGISKIYATPAWVFICMGIAILVFEALIYLVDVSGKKEWFSFIKPAGTSTLTCYLIPYLLYSFLSLINFNYSYSLTYGFGGILRSFFLAFIVIRIVGLMERWGLRLRV